MEEAPWGAEGLGESVPQHIYNSRFHTVVVKLEPKCQLRFSNTLRSTLAPVALSLSGPLWVGPFPQGLCCPMVSWGGRAWGKVAVLRATETQTSMSVNRKATYPQEEKGYEMGFSRVPSPTPNAWLWYQNPTQTEKNTIERCPLEHR